MILDSKPLDKIEEGDLQVLVDNKVSERKRIEYKRDYGDPDCQDTKIAVGKVSSPF